MQPSRRWNTISKPVLKTCVNAKRRFLQLGISPHIYQIPCRLQTGHEQNKLILIMTDLSQINSLPSRCAYIFTREPGLSLLVIRCLKTTTFAWNKILPTAIFNQLFKIATRSGPASGPRKGWVYYLKNIKIHGSINGGGNSLHQTIKRVKYASF